MSQRWGEQRLEMKGSHLRPQLEGSFERKSNDRAASLWLAEDGRLLLCQNADRSIEVFRVRTAEELKARLARKQKRLREKGKGVGWGEKRVGFAGIERVSPHLPDAEAKLDLTDEFVRSPNVVAQGKIR